MSLVTSVLVPSLGTRRGAWYLVLRKVPMEVLGDGCLRWLLSQVLGERFECWKEPMQDEVSGAKDLPRASSILIFESDWRECKWLLKKRGRRGRSELVQLFRKASTLRKGMGVKSWGFCV